MLLGPKVSCLRIFNTRRGKERGRSGGAAAAPSLLDKAERFQSCRRKLRRQSISGRLSSRNGRIQGIQWLRRVGLGPYKGDRKQGKMACTSSCGGLGILTSGPGWRRMSNLEGNRGLHPCMVPVGLVNRRADSRLRVKHLKRSSGNVFTLGSASNGGSRAPVAGLQAVDVNKDNFEEEVLKSSIPVLVEYWATWCGPCKLMSKVMDWAAQEYEGKIKCVKIETDPNEGLKEKYKVYGLPTVMLFVDGEEVPGSRREGAMNKEKVAALLQQMLPSLANTN